MDPFHDSETNLQKFMGKVPDTFPKTNKPLKRSGWEIIFLLGSLFSGYVSCFGGGVSILSQYHGLPKFSHLVFGDVMYKPQHGKWREKKIERNYPRREKTVGW